MLHSKFIIPFHLPTFHKRHPILNLCANFGHSQKKNLHINFRQQEEEEKKRIHYSTIDVIRIIRTRKSYLTILPMRFVWQSIRQSDDQYDLSTVSRGDDGRQCESLAVAHHLSNLL